MQQSITSHLTLNLCLSKTRSGKSLAYRDVIVLGNLRFHVKYSRSHENEKSAFSNSSSLKSVFEKLCFPDGLVWTVALTIEVEPCIHRHQFFPT